MRLPQSNKAVAVGILVAATYWLITKFIVRKTLVDKNRNPLPPGPHCLAKLLIEVREQEGLDWEDECMLSAVFTLGGVHSTSSIVQWFLALLRSFPEIQTKAHEELDRVGSHEQQYLPYLRAITKEVERCHPPPWMATPHYTLEDFTYYGMFIPNSRS